MTQHAVRLFTLPELLGFLAMKINAKFAAADRYCHSVLLYYQHKFTSWWQLWNGLSTHFHSLDDRQFLLETENVFNSSRHQHPDCCL